MAASARSGLGLAEPRLTRPRRAGARWMESLARRLSDPRKINPFYVFAGGLSVVIPVWLLFFNR